MSKLVVTNIETQNIKFDSDTTAFTISNTGTLSGSGVENFGMVKHSSSTTTVTGLSSLEIDLPTTTDFVALKLIVRGLKGEAVAGNNLWRFRFRSQGGSIITSNSYNFMFTHNYSNDTSHGNTYQHDLNVDNINFGGNVGDGTDDSEMTSMEFDIHNSATSGRYTRGFARKSIEKRHNDTYHYANDGSFTVASSNVLDRIEIAVQNGTAFTSFGYALYKILF